MTTRLMNGLLAFCFAALPGLSVAETPPLQLENDWLAVTLEPDYGARASSIYARQHDYEFVVNWSPSEDASTSLGGAFAGIMVGSFTSGRDEAGQLNQTYEVVESTSRSARLRWMHEATLFTGLQEERTVTLSDDRPELTLHIEVTNTTDDNRVIAYRFQDWTGTGRNGGFESAYITPYKTDQPHVYTWPQYYPPSGHQFYLYPDEQWFARADLPNDLGLVVDVTEAKVTSFLQYFSRSRQSALRTAEIYFPLTRLAPGESWSMTMTYRLFHPSRPDATLDDAQAKWLSADRIRTMLDQQPYNQVRNELPLNAEMRLPIDDAPFDLTPAHPTDATLGTDRVQQFGSTLKHIHLYGTPGEYVPFAFNAQARQDVRRGTVSFSDFTHANGRDTIDSSLIDTRYVSSDGYGYLLNDWELSRNVPEEIGQLNNNVQDATTLTPFTTTKGHAAPIWSVFRLPDNATPGTYTARAAVANEHGDEQHFNIKLTVYPFQLQQPDDKIYGSFFRYRLQRGDDPAPYETTRDVMRKALRGADEMGYNGLVIYPRGDDAIWMLDQCVEMGWKNATFVLISPAGLDAEALNERYAEHNFTILAWVIDEPRYVHRGDIEKALRRYDLRLQEGFIPTYTPNSPFALILAEMLDEFVPILVTSVPQFLDVTRQYRERGRDIYWYSAGLSAQDNLSRIQKRLVRGVYLWKEPVNGIIDWGEDSSHARKSVSSLAGFAGTDVVHRTSRENVRQALIDMRYLYTLERALENTADESLRAEGEALLTWIRSTFTNNPSSDAMTVADQAYLDNLRRQAAKMLVKLNRE